MNVRRFRLLFGLSDLIAFRLNLLTDNARVESDTDQRIRLAVNVQSFGQPMPATRAGVLFKIK